jgi:hypothetical protein
MTAAVVADNGLEGRRKGFALPQELFDGLAVERGMVFERGV